MSHSVDSGMLKFALIFLTMTSLLLTFSAYIPTNKTAIIDLTEDQIDIVTTPTSDYLTIIERLIILATVQPEFALLSLIVIPMGLVFLIIVGVIIRGFLI